MTAKAINIKLNRCNWCGRRHHSPGALLLLSWCEADSGRGAFSFGKYGRLRAAGLHHADPRRLIAKDQKEHWRAAPVSDSAPTVQINARGAGNRLWMRVPLAQPVDDVARLQPTLASDFAMPGPSPPESEARTPVSDHRQGGVHNMKVRAAPGPKQNAPTLLVAAKMRNIRNQ